MSDSAAEEYQTEDKDELQNPVMMNISSLIPAVMIDNANGTTKSHTLQRSKRMNHEVARRVKK